LLPKFALGNCTCRGGLASETQAGIKQFPSAGQSGSAALPDVAVVDPPRDGLHPKFVLGNCTFCGGLASETQAGIKQFPSTYKIKGLPSDSLFSQLLSV
jgi:hypothetical protein